MASIEDAGIDDEIKRRKEERYFGLVGTKGSASLGDPKPCSCGRPIYPLEYSEESNDLGEPIYNSRCSRCIYEEARLCSYCLINRPISSTYKWCAPCAIVENEKQVGTKASDGHVITKDEIQHRIDSFMAYI